MKRADRKKEGETGIRPYGAWRRGGPPCLPLLLCVHPQSKNAKKSRPTRLRRAAFLRFSFCVLALAYFIMPMMLWAAIR